MAHRIEVNISGAEHSGKGHLMAIIAKQLRSLGLDVVVQGEDTHNKEKMQKELLEASDKLLAKGVQIVITEMQTNL